MTEAKDYTIQQAQGELEEMISGWVEANNASIIAEMYAAHPSEMSADDKEGFLVLALHSGQTLHAKLTIYP